MSSRTAGDAIKQFSNLVITENLVQKYNDILDLITGPLSVAKDKLKTVDS